MKLFVLLAVLGIIAAQTHVHIPHTEVIIDGRWAFGFLGFALLRRWWAALILGAILSYPYGTAIPLWIGFGGNMLYAVPALLVIRPLSNRMQKRWGPDWPLWLGWSALILACYQAFTTPVVWGVIALTEHQPVWPHVLNGWKTQPFFVESILVALFSATAMVALVALKQFRVQQQRLAHVNSVLLGIRNVNQLIVTEDDPQNLVALACVNLTDTMGYLNAWIALFGGEAGRSLGLPAEKPVSATAEAGFEGGFETMKNQMESGDLPPCVKHALERDEVIVTGNPAEHCPDCPLSSGYDKLTGFARRLHFSGVTYGILSAAVPVEYAGDNEERELFDEVAGDLAYALHKIASARRLEESRRRYLEIFERSRDGFVMVAPEGRIIDANLAFCEMLGYSLYELRSLPDFYQITPERWHEWESKEIWENRLMRQGYSGVYEKEYIRKDGVVFPVELRSYAVRNGEGEIDYLWGAARDITELKKARDALQTQLQLERGISAASTCLLTAGDGDRNITESLNCLCEAADVSRVYMFQNFHDDADGLCMRQTHEACGTEIVPQIDNPELQHVIYTDGFERWREELSAGRYISGHVADFPEGEREILESQEIVSLLVIPLFVSGAWHGFIGFDETRSRREWLEEEMLLLRTAAEFLGGYLTRLKTEKALKENEEQFRSLVEHAQAGIWTLDAAAVTTYVNPRMAEILGYAVDDMIGSTLFDFMDEHWRGVALENMQRRRSGISELHDFEFVRKDGEKVYATLSASPIKDERGAFAGAMAVVIDITEKIRHAEALHISEERFKTLFESLSSGCCLDEIIYENGKAVDYRILDVNPSYEKIMGISRVKARNALGSQLYGTGEAPFLSTLSKVVETGEPVRFETFFEPIQRNLEFTVTRPAKGMFSTVFSDITDRKLSEAELLRLLSAVEQTGEMVVITDTDGTIEYVNPAFERVTGYAENEAIGQNPRILKSGQQDAAFYGRLWQTILSGSTWKGQLTNKTKEGLFYIEAATISPVFDNANQIVNFVAVKRDITEEIRAEKELKESEKKFRTLVDQAADMLLVHDMEGRIIDVNQASINGYGYSREELLSMHVAELDPDYAAREDSGRFWGRFGMKEPLRFEARQKRKDETIFPVEVTLTKLMINQQLVVMGLCRDISDRKNAENEREKFQARLQQAQKMEAIGALAGGIAHDFNNLLCPIVGMSEMLLEDIPRDSLEYDNLQEILTAGKRGSELVKQILAFSRQSEGKKIPVRIQQVLKEVIKMVRATIPASISISQHIDWDCGLVMADPTQLHQIAMNLITNAYHAVDPANGHISIHLKEVLLEPETLSERNIEHGSYALLTVSDNGCGIAPDNMDKIFDPYFTTKEQGKGTGIGLSTVYGIIKEHGGDIQVYSELEQGSSFNIYLPLRGGVQESPSVSVEETIPSGNERILLVDDEQAVARIEKQMLERLGYRVTFRVSSLDALEAFKAAPDSYDLVITDMAMPNMTGNRLAEELIAIRPDIPVIICTGFSEQLDADRAKELGIRGFLMKPIVRTEMAKLIREVLDVGPV